MSVSTILPFPTAPFSTWIGFLEWIHGENGFGSGSKVLFARPRVLLRPLEKKQQHIPCDGFP